MIEVLHDDIFISFQKINGEEENKYVFEFFEL